MNAPAIVKSAVVDGPCRFSLGRQWKADAPVAAWLLCNPSTADADLDDPTCRRIAHFTRSLGCGAFNVVNIWPLRTAYPADLWKMLAAGQLTQSMNDANALAIDVARIRADVLVVGFGVEPPRRHPAAVDAALRVFSEKGARPLLCLGTSPDGWPLHPLARGKFAIPNHRQLVRWERPA